MSTGTGIQTVDGKVGRGATVISTFTSSTSVLVVSRPAAKLSPLVQSVFVRLLGRRGTGKGAVFVSDRVFRRIRRIYSHITVVHSKVVVSIVSVGSVHCGGVGACGVRFGSVRSFRRFHDLNCSLRQIGISSLRLGVVVRSRSVGHLVRSLGGFGLICFGRVGIAFRSCIARIFGKRGWRILGAGFWTGCSDRLRTLNCCCFHYDSSPVNLCNGF